MQLHAIVLVRIVAHFPANRLDTSRSKAGKTKKPRPLPLDLLSIWQPSSQGAAAVRTGVCVAVGCAAVGGTVLVGCAVFVGSSVVVGCGVLVATGGDVLVARGVAVEVGGAPDGPPMNLPIAKGAFVSDGKEIVSTTVLVAVSITETEALKLFAT